MTALIILELAYGIALILFSGYVIFRKKYRLLNSSPKKGMVSKHTKRNAGILFAGGVLIAALSVLSFWMQLFATIVVALMVLSLAFYVFVITQKKDAFDCYLELQRAEIDFLDRKMRRLFVKRMKVVTGIGEYKKKKNLPVHDFAREQEVLKKQKNKVPKEYRSYFHTFLTTEFALSGALQKKIKSGHLSRNSIRVALPGGGYEVLVHRGALLKLSRIIRLTQRRTMIVTDDGIPVQYVEAVKEQCEKAFVLTLPAGEASKNLGNLQLIWKTMQENLFDRNDCVVAIGGGMVGDLAGFAAGCYLRGVDFFNVPTSLVAMVDSSIGGKNGIDFGGFKNQVGLFYQPKCVIVDPNLLSTLPHRQLVNGFAEILKIATVGDAELFRLFEQAEEEKRIDEVILKAIRFKVSVVEQDEREHGIRRVLNFGHTVGHALEMADSSLCHGECVALGMLAESSSDVRLKLISIYRRIGLPTTWNGDVDKLFDAVVHDKKRVGHHISYVFVRHVGEYEMEEKLLEDWKKSALLHGRDAFKQVYES